jgi:tetratricopeptide (TPR) repeat protein
MPEAEFKVEEWIENRYRVLSVIGSGGMGTLYRVSDEARNSEIVALKTVKLHVSAAEKPESVERFQREFQILTQLQHPNLVSVYNYGVTTEGELYFTMDWVQGQDLESGLRQLKPAATIPVMVQVCRALAYLHARGVIHGDLKPSNVLLTGDQVKIVDFGVALEVRSPEVRARYYTPGYSAPEVRQPGPIDHQADLYSLGAMWYALLVGEAPLFLPGTEPLIPLMLDDVLEEQDEIPVAVGVVISRLMATSREERYASANEVIEAVNEITGSTYELETQETAASYALRTHFVDREVEMAMLQVLWEQAQSDEGKLVLISGESGVGKTRLVSELEVQAELEGARVVWGQCVESGGSAYHPWREVLRVLVRYVEGVDEATMQRVGPVLAALLPDLWEREYMRELEPPAALDPQAAQQRLNDAIVQVLHTAAGLRPTVIVIENVHWGDEAALEMLRFLARTPGQVGLLTCVTYRDDEIGADHPLERLAGERVERIRLRRLSPEVTTELVCSMLGLDELPALLAERVQQTTGGNALFVQELIRSLATEGEVLHRTVGGWQVDGKALEGAQLPEGIRQVVGRRLGQLSAEGRQVLSWAAMMGMVFWEGGVAAVGQVAWQRVRMALREGLEQGLVVVRDETSFAGEREYLFRNPTVWEVGYESVPWEERRGYHSRAAAWLMARSEEEAGEHLGLIADHLEGAGQTEQAITYLRRAGEQAAEQFANAEAVNYLSRALDLMPEDDQTGRYALLLAREGVHHVQGAREAQTQDLAALQALSEALGDDQRRAEVALRQASYAEATGNYPAAMAAAQAAIALAQATQDICGEAEGYWRWGYALWRQGNYEAAQIQLEQALTFARSAGMHQVEADSLRNLGIVSAEQGGNYAETQAYYQQALRIYREIGDRVNEGETLNDIGLLFIKHGNYGEARTHFEQALYIHHEIGNRRNERMTLANLGLLSHSLGDEKAGLEYSQQALSIAQEIGERTGQGYSLTYIGHTLAGLGHLAEAADAYRQAMAVWRGLGRHNIAMEPLAGLARVCLTQRDLTQAQVHVEKILSHLENHTLEGAEEPFRVYLTCYCVLCANQDPRAQTVLDTAYNLLQEWAASINDEELRRSFLENAPAHREIVREFAKRE